MSHATPEELHDHAYGFRHSEHVAGCDDCLKTVADLHEEGDGLRRALREAPAEAPAELLSRLHKVRARRHWFSAPALAAAALLLGALALLLFHPKDQADPPALAATPISQEAELEQLAAQLKNPDPVHQELARLGLKKYGGLAVPVLERLKADPVLLEECRGYTVEDLALYRKASNTLVNVRWKDTPLTTAVDQIRELAQISFHISNVDNPDGVRVTLALQNATVIETLDALKKVTGIPWSRSLGTENRSQRVPPPNYEPLFLFGVEQPAPRSSAPVRIQVPHPHVAALLRNPGSMKPEEIRDAVRTLTLAARRDLWTLLDSPRKELRDAAAAGLRALYGPPPHPPLSALEKELEMTRIDSDFEQTPFSEILLTLGNAENRAIVLDPRLDIPDIKATFKVKDLALKNCLKLLVSQLFLDVRACDRWVLVTKPEWVPFQQKDRGSLWLSPEEATRAEGWIDDLASEDPARHETAKSAAREGGRRGLEWLLLASNATEPPLSARFGETLRSVAADLGIPLADAPAAAEAQKLSPAQQAIRNRTLALKTSTLTLQALLKEHGIRARIQAPVVGPLLVSAPSLTVDDLLRAVLHPLGADYYMDGDTIVVDSAKNTRAAVEKK
jgi:hypothetical protein